MEQETSRGRRISPASLPPALIGSALAMSVVSVVPVTSIVFGGSTPLARLGIGTGVRPLQTVLVVLVLVLVGGALLGVARRVPAWSYTWVTSAIVTTAFGLAILSDDAGDLISPIADMALLIGLVAILAAVSVVASRRGELDSALVALGFLSSFGLFVLFSAVASPMLRMDLAILTLPFGLLFAWLVLRLESRRPCVSVRDLVRPALLAALMIGTYGFAVAGALSWSLALTFMRVLGTIAAIGLAAPLILGRLLAGRRNRVRLDQRADR